jgi:hypothetical protein
MTEGASHRPVKGPGSLDEPCGLKPAAAVKAADFNPRGKQLLRPEMWR